MEKVNHEYNAELNTQRIMIRVMYKNKWIDEKKYKVSMETMENSTESRKEPCEAWN